MARGWWENTERSYKNLGNILNDARYAGLLDWDWMTDRTRNSNSRPSWDSPLSIMRSAARQFHHPWWSDQTMHVEVWVEKEALAGVVERVCDRFDVTWMACRGYMSASEQHVAGMRFVDAIRDNRKVRVLHLGDHDPSGMQMTEDNDRRLSEFICHHLGEDFDELIEPWELAGSADLIEQAAERFAGEYQPSDEEGLFTYEGLFEVQRIALNMDQVRQYNPPPNPAKVTDSRFASYQAVYGDQSWELDALQPAVLDALIAGHIEASMDPGKFAIRQATEETLKAKALRMMDAHGGELL